MVEENSPTDTLYSESAEHERQNRSLSSEKIIFKGTTNTQS